MSFYSGIHNQEMVQGPLTPGQIRTMAGERRPPSALLKPCLICKAARQWLQPRLQNQKFGFKSWLCLLGCVSLGKSCDPERCCED